MRGNRESEMLPDRPSGHELFNKIQVTCVGARVSDFAINESDHALINVIGSKERLSAKSTWIDDFGLKSKNFKLKSLILAQIERWRHA